MEMAGFKHAIARLIADDERYTGRKLQKNVDKAFRHSSSTSNASMPSNHSLG